MPSLEDQWRRLRNLKKRSGKKVHLPIELHLLIIEQVERREDRYSLLLVCRDFYFATEKVLYRDIHLNGPKPSLEARLRLFRTITSSERIAHHIQSLTLSSILTYEVAIGTFFPALSQALCATRNLKKFCCPWSFDWNIFWATWRNQPIPLFSGCTLQLHPIVVQAISPLIILDRAFLNLQTELAILDVHNCVEFPFPPNAFPKLTALRVSAKTAQLIKRPTLRALNLTESIPGLITPLLTSKLVTSLRISYAISSEEFSAILRAYPCLRYLRLDFNTLTNDFPNWPALQRLEYILTHSAHHITHLFALENLTLYFSDPLKLKGITSIRDMVFTSLKNLQVITLGHGYPGIYVQLRRGAKHQEITDEGDQGWCDDRWL